MRDVGMHITILGSGSAGNCTLIESDQTRILVDAGLSGRQILQRLAMLGQAVEELDGIVLTHEHTDHSRGLGTLCKSRPLPVYANRLTAEAIAAGADWNGKTRVSWRLFCTGAAFPVGNLTVESFSVPHDAQDPVGFVIRNGEVSVGVLTDLGHVTRLAAERVRSADALVLEANHDLKLLQEDPHRPWATKQRIMSRHGHLSNDAAAALAGELARQRLRHVMLAHLSRDCNRPELAERAVGASLLKSAAHPVSLLVAAQHAPTATVTI
jgi:phosphoribosyl 1,2-cyclic phosphodiesterase